jgi:hypothetical protein
MPPRRRAAAAFRLRSSRTAFGSLVIVFAFFAAFCAFLIFRLAACVCLLEDAAADLSGD